MKISIKEIRAIIRNTLRESDPSRRRIVLPKWQQNAEKEKLQNPDLEDWMLLSSDPLEKIGFKNITTERQKQLNISRYYSDSHQLTIMVQPPVPWDRSRALRVSFKHDTWSRFYKKDFEGVTDLKFLAVLVKQFLERTAGNKGKRQIRAFLDDSRPVDPNLVLAVNKFKKIFPNGEALEFVLWMTGKSNKSEIKEMFSDMTGYDRIESVEEAEDALKMLQVGESWSEIFEFLIPAAIILYRK